LAQLTILSDGPGASWAMSEQLPAGPARKFRGLREKGMSRVQAA